MTRGAPRFIGTQSETGKNPMRVGLMALVVVSLPAACLGAVQLPSSIGGLGVNVQDTTSNPTTDFAMMQAAGVAVARWDLTWHAVETTKGQYNWSDYDVLCNACVSHGIWPLFILCYSNSLYDQDGVDSDTFRQGFAQYAAAAADHFKGKGAMYEIWNEPNSTFWPGGSDVSAYMSLVQQAAPAIRYADPNAAIIAPATLGVDTTTSPPGFLSSCFAGGLLNLVDAVSVHPYRAANPETAVASYASVRNLINQYKPGVPIACSEYGYSVLDPSNTPLVARQLQGDYMARAFLVNLSQGIPLSTWFEWMEPSTPNGFGVVTRDLQRYPAYNELQLLTRSLSGETFTSKLTDHNSNDWLLVFTGGGHTTLAAWTTGSPRTVTVSGWGTLHLTATPYYVNPTLLPGDANLDDRVDVLDLAILAANYRKSVSGGWTHADFNHDGVVDVGDLALLAANYRHSLASDVVPAYDGLDAEALELLSRAGVTVAPEPGALVLLAAGLSSVLAYAGRKGR
jgi:polysaccharide biosynthesis protein PslG